MKTYLTYKNQIQGFKDVSETVKTVEKIAASSIHFLKQEVNNLNTYSSEIEKVLARLSLFYQEKDNSLLQKKYTKEKLLIILTGDKGLVGGLWHKIISSFLENIKQQYQSIIAVGIKGENYLKEENIKVIEEFSQVVDVSQKEEVEHITDYIFDKFKKGKFSQIDIFYPQFISLVEQRPSFIPFLPFKFKLTEKKEGETDISKEDLGLPIFEPSEKKVFDQLLQEYIGVFFHRIVAETKLSEFSARTVAMEHAAVKTDELIQKSSLSYLKERRRAITQKQLESFTAHKIIK